MDPDTPWLSTEQQRVWRNWLRMNTELSAALHRRLQADSDLSLPDYDVLVQLTDTAEARVRVLDLARALRWERSRLSHHVKRMEGRGLVRREEVPGDGRGAYVALTSHGRTVIERAAPAHVRTVRGLVVDAVTDAELAALGAVVDKVLARLAAAEETAPPERC
ncbi:MarR family winged helix-turn-helix transcriptional regulator [Streptomyces sp. Z26]|uniref:MarR family winged helix-turn-helix transcriptional regulator n=1 Tax=Streptomyces TaxID=1883 RepID=UPI001F0C913E|nr:MarR family winged helix-turn-helix transcriptional regulator [Streptomyces sp. Z26]